MRLLSLLLRLISLLRLPRPCAEANRRRNAVLPGVASGPAPLFAGQGNPAFAGLRYGVSHFEKTGCGVLACRNVLALLGQEVPLAELIYTMERCGGQMLLGAWGTAPYALAKALGRYGVHTLPLPNADEAAAYLHSHAGAVLMLTFWNRRGHPFAGMHTVAVRALDSGAPLVYNRFGGDTAPRRYDTLEQLLAPGAYIAGYAAGV